jgi:hypothetical protein
LENTDSGVATARNWPQRRARRKMRRRRRRRRRLNCSKE